MAKQNQIQRFLPVAFYFQVEFQGDPPVRIVAFKEVSGLSVEMELETVNEGGENDYEIKLPKGVKHGNIVMKRVVSSPDTNLGLWIKESLEGGLNGFTDTIRAVFPQSTTQICVVHQIRNSCRYVVWKDMKAFTADMKEIYTSPNRETGRCGTCSLEQVWGSKYRHAVQSWHRN